MSRCDQCGKRDGHHPACVYAIAMEAQRAETEGLGAKHDSAGPKDIAQSPQEAEYERDNGGTGE